MSDEYLKNTRKSGLTLDNSATEAELINTQEAIKDAWQDLQNIKKKIAEAKIQALKEVDTTFYEELKDAESTYAMLLTMTR
jgi:predicted phage-related endonuclease